MSEVRHVVVGRWNNDGEQFNQTIGQHKPFGFDWDRREDEHQLHVGEHHSKGQKHAEHRARSANCRCVQQQIQLSEIWVNIVLTLHQSIVAFTHHVLNQFRTY